MMNKKIFQSALLIFILSIFLQARPLKSQSENPTEIFIIGTVHVSTSNFNSDTLLQIFNKINPDLILVECDSSYMTKDFNIKDEFKYSFPETRAITSYLSEKLVELRPYDITDRDVFLNDKQRRQNHYNFFKDISDLSQKGELDADAINILNKILAMMNLADVMANSPTSYMNSPEGSINIDTINYYTYTGFVNLIESSPALSQYKSYRENEIRYWDKRNDIMLENILSIKKSYESKRIIVLCGFSHKNILKNGLILKSVVENLTVKEFWE